MENEINIFFKKNKDVIKVSHSLNNLQLCQKLLDPLLINAIR
ncbi:hypothetical protein KB13_345 [beta proteobacterium KB13]|uniref:Uncharacterized protein n=1 Tax=beta proteobacterium KB13 TaxID=314607 RepID=B6BWZ5_9PROT|nr:hypothetical protein KB13_345 [beta proteobacterium KB13]